MVLTPVEIEAFLLILARIAGLFITAPLLSTRSFPTYAKSVFALWVAAIIWFVAPLPYGVPDTVPIFVLLLALEVFIGYIIGFIMNIIIQSVQAAGDLIDTQMGLSVANILSPTTGQMGSIIGSLTFYIALITFLIVNGHHMLLRGLYQSFTALPVVGPLNLTNQDFIIQLISLIQFFWLTAMKLAAPVILLIFLMDYAFGLVSRVAPQVNVFMLGFQVKPSLGLIGMIITMPLILRQISNLVATVGYEVTKLFTYLK